MESSFAFGNVLELRNNLRMRWRGWDCSGVKVILHLCWFFNALGVTVRKTYGNFKFSGIDFESSTISLTIKGFYFYLPSSSYFAWTSAWLHHIIYKIILTLHSSSYLNFNKDKICISEVFSDFLLFRSENFWNFFPSHSSLFDWIRSRSKLSNSGREIRQLW